MDGPEPAVTKEPAGRLERRLSRILLLLPYAIAHPGVTVEELSERFGVKRAEVARDLELAFMCGLPGYGPGDLIDVAIEGDRVYIGMADYFAAPLRLTPTEALALLAGAHAMAALPGMEDADALRRALGKLEHAVGLQSSGGEGGVHFKLTPGPAVHLERLETALRDRKRVRLEYASSSRAEMTTREVDPWALVVAWGRSYLVGWDHLSGDERMFRADRIKSVEPTGKDAVVPADFDPEPYRRAFVERAGARTVSFEISPAVARWFADYYSLRSNRVLPDSWHAVALASESDHWAATLVLRLGGDVRSVAPPGVVARARELATDIARAHHRWPR